MRRSATLPLYLGGFLGPFGGSVLGALLPEVRDALHVSTAAVATGLPAYLVPFALVQLVSGTIGERRGRRRVVRLAYIAYAAASLLAAFAPSLAPFLVARALQGVANAFTTPILLAALADAVPRERLGRSVGQFAGIQAGAIALSPLIGGVLAEVSWRLAFALPGLVALGLVGFLPPDGERLQRASIRGLISSRFALLCAAAALGYLGVTGLPFLVGLRLDDAFSLTTSLRGVLLAGYGIAGLAFGRAGGRLVERFGAAPTAAVAALACAVFVVAVGRAGTPALATAAWIGAGVGSAALWAGFNTLALDAVAGNRAGGTSIFSAFKFGGNALAPVVWLPVYAAAPGLAFAGAGATTAAVAVIGLALARDVRR